MPGFNVRMYYDDIKDLHRIDGPAIIIVGRDEYGWYIHGNQARSCAEFQEMSGVSNEELLALILTWGKIVG